MTGEKMTLAEATRRYELEIMPRKTSRWNSRGSELSTIRMILADDLSRKNVAQITSGDLAAWRDRRLQSVSPASAQRYMNTLSSILSACEKDWQIIPTNPMRQVRRPPASRPRKRRPTPEEMERLAVVGADLNMAMGRAWHAFLFAIETGMRANEIAMMEWVHVDLERRVVHVPLTKNGEPRDVPLSKEAMRLLRALPEADPVFNLGTGQKLSNNWYQLREKAGVTGLNFHDSRHEAITRISRKLDVLALARMVGHKNIRELMTYYNETADELAKRLD
ncbi:tyrosine-type recombinase/integrase [Thioclava dalianensis]|uniref:tyrosine-type recombinase/integrase n=1 Tax=Thioclava dalianensis TaxID=1185766 RepID=UPI000AE051B1|nr:site-specific integrase [Thioclava dalianensis]